MNESAQIPSQHASRYPVMVANNKRSTRGFPGPVDKMANARGDIGAHLCALSEGSDEEHAGCMSDDSQEETQQHLDAETHPESCAARHGSVALNMEERKTYKDPVQFQLTPEVDKVGIPHMTTNASQFRNLLTM